MSPAPEAQCVGVCLPETGHLYTLVLTGLHFNLVIFERENLATP